MGIKIGANSNKAKYLEVVNLATGGGFSLAGNKLQQSSGFKPTIKYSAAFRKKFIQHLGISTNITLHFSSGYKEFNKSGKSIGMPFSDAASGVVGYSSKAGTDLNVILWGSESLDKTVPKDNIKKLLTFRAAILIHELNVHAFSTIANDKRSSYAIMKETKQMLVEGVGIPDYFKQYWSDESGLKTHDSRLNDEKGKRWITPMN